MVNLENFQWVPTFLIQDWGHVSISQIKDRYTSKGRQPKQSHCTKNLGLSVAYLDFFKVVWIARDLGFICITWHLLQRSVYLLHIVLHTSSCLCFSIIINHRSPAVCLCPCATQVGFTWAYSEVPALSLINLPASCQEFTRQPQSPFYSAPK